MPARRYWVDRERHSTRIVAGNYCGYTSYTDKRTEQIAFEPHFLGEILSSTPFPPRKDGEVVDWLTGNVLLPALRAHFVRPNSLQANLSSLRSSQRR